MSITRVDFPKSIFASLFRISPGKDIKTGPVGGDRAILAALLIILGKSSNLLTSVAHFTNGSAIRTNGPYNIGSIRP